LQVTALGVQAPTISPESVPPSLVAPSGPASGAPVDTELPLLAVLALALDEVLDIAPK